MKLKSNLNYILLLKVIRNDSGTEFSGINPQFTSLKLNKQVNNKFKI